MLNGLLGFVLLGVAAAPGEAPADLVARLASNHPAERRAAAEALEQLGEPARPALIEARHSDDLELRARAAALLDAIEGRRLVRATPVRLDFHDRPLTEVIETLRDRTGITLQLTPRFGPPGQQEPRITLETPEPVPFWEAIERLGRAAGLRVASEQETFQLNRNMGFAFEFPPGERPRRPRTARSLLLLPAADDGPIPSSIDGAFRTTIQSVSLHRARGFAPQAPPPGDAKSAAEPRPQPTQRTRFTIVLNVQPEPRLALMGLEGPTLEEAIDDRGRSLRITPEASGPPGGGEWGFTFRRSPFPIELIYPEDPEARSIRSLRGTFTAVVAGPGPDPLVIPLGEDVAGKVFRSELVTLSVDSVKPDPQNDVTQLSLTVRAPYLFRVDGRPSPAPFSSHLRPPTGALLFQVLDEEGRLIVETEQAYDPRPADSMSVRLVAPAAIEGRGPPATLRVLAPTWTTITIPFAFEDIPLF